MSISTLKSTQDSPFPRYVVLDLDKTLVWARKAEISKYPPDDKRNFWIRPYTLELFRVTIRAHFDYFLDELYKKGYKVIVWSAGGDGYVKDIVSVIFKGRHLEYVFTYNHLKEVPNEQKILSLITKYVPDFVPSQARLVDDNTDHGVGQEQSMIIVKPFEFSGLKPKPTEDDSVLLTLADRIDKSFASG